MTNHEHERALDLINMRGVEDISGSDIAWLQDHLSSCLECADYALAFEGAGQLLRSVAITASPALVVRTQERLRLRAAQLREQQARVFLVGLAFCVGVVWSAVSAFIWWNLAGWLARRYDVPLSVVGPGLVLLWLLPAIVLAFVLLGNPHVSAKDTRLEAVHRWMGGDIR